MSQQNIAQLLVGPNSSSSLIRTNSIFTSKKIILNGDNDGIGLLLNNTSDNSIKSLGGADISGKIVCKSDENISKCDNDINASVIFDGGLYVKKKIQVGSDLCVEGVILNKDIATKNNLVSRTEHVVLDILYATKLYCININAFSSTPPVGSNPITSSGNALLDIVIVANMYCPNLHVLDSEEDQEGPCDDLDIDTVLHYYLGENYTGEYFIIDNLYVNEVYCPQVHTVRGRPLESGLGGFGSQSAGTNLGMSAYIGGVQSFDSWKLQMNNSTKKLEIQTFDEEIDEYVDPTSEHRTWISYRNCDFFNGTWSIVRETNNNSINYYKQKVPTTETVYIVSDVNVNVKGGLTKGFSLKRIYVSYEITEQEIQSVNIRMSKKEFDRDNPMNSNVTTNIPIINGNLQEGVSIGTHYRYTYFDETYYANFHQTFTLELECSTKNNSVLKFHGFFIEYQKDESIT